MAAIHGKYGRVRLTASTPTSSTNLTADLAVDKKTLSIAQSTRRHWDRNSSFAVYDGATMILSSDYSVDWVRGKVTMSTARSTAGTYTVDCAWYPTSCLGMTRSWTIDASVDMADATVFPCSTAGRGWREFVPGVGQATIKLGRLWGTSESSAPPFVDRQAVSSPLYVELMPSGTAADKWECYASIQGDAWNVNLDGAIAEDVTLQADGPIYWTTAT
jgi:hypothetical protein